MKSSKPNQEYWFYYPTTVIAFGKFSGHTIHSVLESEPGYLDYCLRKIDNFMLSRRYFRVLEAGRKDYCFSKEAIESLGRKMDMADLWMSKNVKNDFINPYTFESKLKMPIGKALYNICSLKRYFHLMESQKLDEIAEGNKLWFDKYFRNFCEADKGDKIGVKLTFFLINHSFKSVWFQWIKENWFDYTDGQDLYTYCINSLERDINTALIVIIDTSKSLYSKSTTRKSSVYKDNKSEVDEFPARNECLLPSVDYWRHLLTFDGQTKNNWVFDYLINRLKSSRVSKGEVSVDVKPPLSRELANRGRASFYLDDQLFTESFENYYKSIPNNNFLNQGKENQEIYEHYDRFGSCEEDETNHDEDAWDALTDGQYGDWEDRND
ncbi:hypothetical protein I2I05_05160 [Hymenobacter sp. BT683]|uniref:Exodeoxyribonuclease X-like C-terminal domain-containing protein n=1 Tax=Hymenobacter jeongseonensis TaxID=2791027 RepID=A0ABS0IEJ6_9BACT|nr:hypothetical protein [Hymenobacter jeongseonensis]MBF9236777.1 hypothetical protein [Hymenobacter jeongseonensis]